MVKNYDDSIWASRRMDVAKKGLREKFLQNDNLKRMLLETAPYLLVEASPIDRIWGDLIFIWRRLFSFCALYIRPPHFGQ